MTNSYGAACLTIGSEIECLCSLPLEEIAVSARPRPIGVTSSPNCTLTEKLGMHLRIVETLMELKALE